MRIGARPMTKYPDGSHELRNRIIFKVTGRWPESVVQSRLTNTTWDPTTVNALLAEQWEKAGRGHEFRPFTGRGDEQA